MIPKWLYDEKTVTWMREYTTATSGLPNNEHPKEDTMNTIENANGSLSRLMKEAAERLAETMKTKAEEARSAKTESEAEFLIDGTGDGEDPQICEPLVGITLEDELDLLCLAAEKKLRGMNLTYNVSVEARDGNGSKCWLGVRTFDEGHPWITVHYHKRHEDDDDGCVDVEREIRLVGLTGENKAPLIDRLGELFEKASSAKVTADLTAAVTKLRGLVG